LCARIGPFDIPPGYRATFATDMGLSKMVTLSRVGAPRHDYSAVTITKILVYPSNANTQSNAFGRKLGLQLICRHLTTLAPPRIRSSNRAIAFEHYRCDDLKLPMEVAVASIPMPSGLVQVQESGSPKSFDMGAFRRIITSFR
jgi:hypothetical protein